LSIILSLKKGALLDIFEARESIENSCAGFAALRRDEEDLKDLQHALDNMQASFNDPDQYIGHDLNFHKAVINAAKNAVFVDLMEKTYKLLMDTRTSSRKYPSELYREKNFQQHVDIFDGIRAGDSQKASIAMAHHMNHIKKKFLKRTGR